MSSDQTAPVPAGWYPDPYGISEMRWWDGQNWTDSIHPPSAPEPAATAVSAPVSTPVSETTATQEAASAEPAAEEPDGFSDLGLAPAADEQVAEASAPQSHAPQAPVEQAPVEQAPVEQSLPPALVLPDLAPPEPGSLLTDQDSSAPTSPAPEASAPEVSAQTPDTPIGTSPGRLPSRREMRLRKELELESPSSVSAFSSFETLQSPESTSEPDSPAESTQTAGSETAPHASAPDTSLSDAASPPIAVPPASAPTLAEPDPLSSSTPPPVPDSSTATAFDWMLGAQPGESDSPAAAPSPQSAPDTPVPAAPVPATPAAPLPQSTPVPHDAQSGFPPLGTPTGAMRANNAHADDYSDAPKGVTNAWSRDVSASVAPEEINRPTATRKTTVSSWFIAAMPLFAGILSVSAVKGQENYPRYVPAGLDWWMLVVGVIAVLYLVTLVLAIADQRKLDWAGYHQPAHWAWALLGAPIYLLIRTIAVKRETGRSSALLLVWLLLTAVVIGAWFAAQYFAPDLVSGYTLPVL